MEQVKNLIFQNDNFTFYAVAFALVLTVAICLVQVIRTPPLLKRRFDRAVGVAACIMRKTNTLCLSASNGIRTSLMA